MSLTPQEEELLKSVRFEENDLDAVSDYLDELLAPGLPPPLSFPSACSRCNATEADASFTFWYDFVTRGETTEWRIADVPICQACKENVYNRRFQLLAKFYVGIFLSGIAIALAAYIYLGLTGSEYLEDNVPSVLYLAGWTLILIGAILIIFLLVFPRVSKHRFMAWAMKPVVKLNANTGVIVIANRDYAERVRELNPERSHGDGIA